MINGCFDWSNDAENSALHQKNKLHLEVIKLEISFLTAIQFHNILLFLLYFSQVNAALVSIKMAS